MCNSIEIMDSSALASFPNPPADQIIFYGDGDLQFGELRLPEGPGPHPAIVLIHGGCWMAQHDVSHIRKLAAAFTAEGFATWTLEYRRVGDAGGGWTGTFDDIAKGADLTVDLAGPFDLDPDRIVVAGHSAGGHLAIWLASRPSRWPARLRPTAVLALAPAADLVYLHRNGVCQEAVNGLMGGTPAEYPERYRLASGTSRLPLPVPQYIVLGSYDTDWTPVGRRYVEAARQAGNEPNVIDARASGHFEMIDPDSSTWPQVLMAARAAAGLNGTGGDGSTGE
jgi:acetyl esterase/lipase